MASSPFFMGGIVLREKSEKIISKRYNNKILLILILFGEGLSLVERYLFVESQFYVGTYLVVGTLFVFAISNPDFKIPFMEYIGKYMSMYVYIFHIAVGKTLDYIANKLHLWQNQVFMYSRAFIVLFGSLIIAFVIVKMQEKAVKVLKLNLN